LRGLAAFAVPAFTHFQHFGGDKNAYPYNHLALVHWLYVYSQFFVDLFFVLSGYVLTYRYYRPISNGRTTGREFFFLRFARLYPLHLLMLLTVAVVQWWSMAHRQAPVIYPKNDLFHFFLHAFLLHLWFERGLAYNYPAWSICAEAFAYVLFFLYARKRPQTFALACAVTVFVGVGLLSAVTLPFLNRNMARVLVGFFMGALLLVATDKLDRAHLGARWGYGCLVVLAAFAFVSNRIGYDSWVGDDPLPYGLILFPLATVASLRVRPLAWLLSLRFFTFLGDISYAVYLSHVPLQVILLTVARARKLVIPTSATWFFWSWLGSLIVFGTVVHFAFERPARRWLRGRFVDHERPLDANVVAAPSPSSA
jgi:peptidoglycan/LPS O-acetylase OafA/YrhL